MVFFPCQNGLYIILFDRVWGLHSKHESENAPPCSDQT